MLMDEEMFRSDLLPGVQRAVKAFKELLDEDLNVNTQDGLIPEEWLAHVVAAKGKCGCNFDKEWDENTYDIAVCDWYSLLENRQDWYCYWHGISREELFEILRQKQEEYADKFRTQQEKERQCRLKQLHELAEEFGVDVSLLP